MKSLVVATLSAAALLLMQPALAQEDPAVAADTIMREPAKEPTPETLELAKQLVELSGASRTFDELLPNIADQAKNTFIRSNPQMQLGIITVVDKVALEMVARRPELDSALERIWASAFDENQLEELIEFYNSETGKRFAAIQPRLIAAQMSAAQNWTGDISEEMTQRVAEELRAQLAGEAKAMEGAPGTVPSTLTPATPAPAAPAQ
jgi:hypothetical protein